MFAFRGDPPWSGGRRGAIGGFAWGAFAWGLFFAGSGASILIASLSGDLPPDGELGGKIVAGTFLFMGVPALLWAMYGIVTGLGERDQRPPAYAWGATRGGVPMPSLSNASPGLTWGSVAGSSRSGGGDSLARLERLQRLRDSGALTQREFDREKSKILSEM